MASNKPLLLPESRHVKATREDGTKSIRVLPPEGHGNMWVGSTR